MHRFRPGLIALVLCVGLSAVYAGNARRSFATNQSVPTFGHVFEIVLENHETSSIIGSSSAPFINSLVQQYGLAANYYGIRHPSLPNYLTLIGGDTFGVSSNCTTCFINAPNLVDQLEGAGKSWNAYMESMPKPCFVGDSLPLYKQKHNPFIYFDSIRKDPARCAKIVPLTQLDTDLKNNAVPNYVWITPNMCNSMHDCSVSTGDTWLKTWVGKIIASPAWQQNGVLFITFDEGSTDAGCCTYASGGKIVTLVISPLGKPGYKSTVAYDHYSLLRTIEDSWGLPPLGKAACSCSAPMSDFFTEPVDSSPTPTVTDVPTNTASATDTPIATSTPVETSVPSETAPPTATPIQAGLVLTTTVGPRADAYVAQDKQTTASATSSQLLAVSGADEKRSFLGFSVAGLPADAQVVSAKLRLSVINDATSGGNLYSLSNTSWPETITWRSQPAIDGPQLASLGPVALNSVVEVDVGAAVHGNGEYSFAIVAPAGNRNAVGYASSNNANVALRPQLIVVSQVPAPTAVPTEPAPVEPAPSGAAPAEAATSTAAPTEAAPVEPTPSEAPPASPMPGNGSTSEAPPTPSVPVDATASETPQTDALPVTEPPADATPQS